MLGAPAHVAASRYVGALAFTAPQIIKVVLNDRTTVWRFRPFLQIRGFHGLFNNGFLFGRHCFEGRQLLLGEIQEDSPK